MSNSYGIGDGIEFLCKFALFSLVVLVPLAIWKLVEIVMWICQHVRIGVTP